MLGWCPQWQIYGGMTPVCSPLTAQNFLNVMQFFGNFGKIICWHPLLREILDLPLVPFHMVSPGSAPNPVLSRKSWIRPWSPFVWYILDLPLILFCHVNPGSAPGLLSSGIFWICP